MSRPFTTSRDDGRSRATVAMECVIGHTLGDLVSYDELVDALQDGDDETITRRHVHMAVTGMRRRLVREHQRAVITVRGVGYRVAEPDQFKAVVNGRQRRSQVQLTHAREIMQHAPYQDMSPVVRDTLQAHSTLIEGLYLGFRQMDRRMARVEDEFRKMQRQPPDVDEEASD